MLNILELGVQGLSIREIARRTGHDRKTVRKWLRQREIPRYGPRPPLSSKLDPYKPYLQARIAVGVWNANRLLEELRTQGYSGGKTILKDYLKPLRPPRVPVATIRFETAPGEQAQVDFASFSYEAAGKRQRLWAFVMILSYSRALYVEFVARQDLATLLRCHLHAFSAFGGVPATVLYDNLKTVVLGRDGQGRPQWHAQFADFALTLGFRPQLCQPYRAQTKGRVERAIGYLRSSFWPGRRFLDLEDLNRQAQAWVVGVANRRIHGTTGRRPLELLAEEDLQPLPPPAVTAPYLAVERRVGRDGFVSYQGSHYGVPWPYAGERVSIQETEGAVEIRARERLVARHPRAAAAGAWLPLASQWKGLPLTGSRRPQTALAFQVSAPEVEVRSLLAYDALVGGRP